MNGGEITDKKIRKMIYLVNKILNDMYWRGFKDGKKFAKKD
jgi:hypothetical protein